jgi:hypothetical protein
MGAFSGEVLISHFGDGRIYAFDRSGEPEGTLRRADGHPLRSDGLWALMPGNRTAAPAPTSGSALGRPASHMGCWAFCARLTTTGNLPGSGVYQSTALAPLSQVIPSGNQRAQPPEPSHQVL